MSNYFYDLLPAEELSQLQYFPTFPEFLAWIGEHWSERIALKDDNNSITYSQLVDRVARRRAFLAEQGVAKGDRVAIWERNSIDAVESFMAVVSMGAVGINLPTQLPVPAIVGCTKRFGTKILVVRDEFAPALEGQGVATCSSSAMAQTGIPAAVVDKEEPAAIFFTGGTTGAPKGAILPHRALMRGCFNGCFASGSQLGGEVVIGLLPLSHVFGLVYSTLSTLYTGATWHAAEDMKATITKLPVIRPTKLVLVPGICEIILGLAKMYGPQFLGGRLKLVISGAANVPPRLISEFDKLGIKLLFGYGMTEGANLTSGNADVHRKPTSVGKIYPGQETKIVDGELWVKGDNVFLGYYGDPVQTAAALTEDGWLKTGDLVRFDEEGFLYITGRIKNIIVLASGENVSPEEVEEPFYQYPTVKDCLVSETEMDGVPCIGIEILPVAQAFEGKSQEEIEAYFKNLVAEVNKTLPTTHRVTKVVVRKEDFKRTGSLKIARNQN